MHNQENLILSLRWKEDSGTLWVPLRGLMSVSHDSVIRWKMAQYGYQVEGQ
jgi:hypothetical protein